MDIMLLLMVIPLLFSVIGSDMMLFWVLYVAVLLDMKFPEFIIKFVSPEGIPKFNIALVAVPGLGKLFTRGDCKKLSN